MSELAQWTFACGSALEAYATAGNVTFTAEHALFSPYAMRVATDAESAGSIILKRMQATVGKFSGEQFGIDSGGALHIGTWFMVRTLPGLEDTSDPILELPSAGNGLCLKLDYLGRLGVFVDDGGPQLGDWSAYKLALHTPYWLQLRSEVGAVGTEYELKANGVSVLEDVAYHQEEGVYNSITLGRVRNESQTAIDFVYGVGRARDDALPEPCRAVMLPVRTAAGTYADFAADNGAIDEEGAHDSAATEIVSAVAGARQSGLPVNPFLRGLRDIVSVTAWGVVHSAAGGVPKVSVSVLSGGVTAGCSAPGNPGTTYVARGWLVETDPATGLPWTPAGLAAAQAVLRNASATALNIYCTQLGLLVVYCPGAWPSGGWDTNPNRISTPGPGAGAPCIGLHGGHPGIL